MKFFYISLIISLFLIFIKHDISADQALPKEIYALINKNSRVIKFCIADLNGDGRPDYLVAAELDKKDREYIENSNRKLFIILKQKKNYAVHSVSRRALLCSNCGGVWGDPFSEMNAGPKWFEVSHFGGSREKWSNSFKFGYSRKFNKWQLVEAEVNSIDSLDPESPDNFSRTYLPPDDFGRINFEEFDPTDYLGRGLK